MAPLCWISQSINNFGHLKYSDLFLLGLLSINNLPLLFLNFDKNKYQNKNLKHKCTSCEKKKSFSQVTFFRYHIRIFFRYHIRIFFRYHIRTLFKNCEKFKSHGQMKNFPMWLSSAAECRGEGFALPRTRRSVHIGEGE